MNSNEQPRKEFTAKKGMDPFNKRREEELKCSGKSSTLLQPAPKGRNWIWLGLRPDTTIKIIKTYTQEEWPNKDIQSFDLKSRGFKKYSYSEVTIFH